MRNVPHARAATRFASLACAAAAFCLAIPSSAGAAGVLVIGDSLELGTGPYLEQALPGIPVTVDAERGRASDEGVAVLESRLRPSNEIVVFDLGTNNDPSRPEAFAGDLATARALTGDRCLVVATIRRPPFNGTFL